MQFPFTFWQSPIQINLATQGIVAYYKLDDIGNIFRDSTVNNLNLTALCTPQLTGGLILTHPSGTNIVTIDNAFSCTGYNGMIDTTQNSKFTITSDKTFVLWHKSSLTADPGRINDDQLLWHGGFGNISTNGTYGNTGGYNLIFQQDGNGSFNRLTWQMQVTGTPNTISVTGLGVSGAFQFLVVQVDYKSGVATLQVNNNLTYTSPSWGANNAPFASGGFIIGSAPYLNALGIPLNGWLFGSGKCIIDEVGIWNRKLTSNELNYLYNNGKGRTYPFLPQ